MRRGGAYGKLDDWKERAGGAASRLCVQTTGSHVSRQLKLFILRAGEVIGMPCVGEECVAIRKNTRGEGGLLDSNCR